MANLVLNAGPVSVTVWRTRAPQGLDCVSFTKLSMSILVPSVRSSSGRCWSSERRGSGAAPGCLQPQGLQPLQGHLLPVARLLRRPLLPRLGSRGLL